MSSSYQVRTTSIGGVLENYFNPQESILSSSQPFQAKFVSYQETDDQDFYLFSIEVTFSESTEETW